MNKLNVGFICIHNSCRSQMAEAIAKSKYSNLINVYSAGTNLSRSINKDAVRIIKAKYDIDMNKTQQPKLLSDLPDLDILITMGCDVECPIVENRYSEDWDLDDPTGSSDKDFLNAVDRIELNLIKVLKCFNLLDENSIKI